MKDRSMDINLKGELKMIILSESVKRYGLGLVKIIEKQKEDNQRRIINEKKVYVMGVKVFEFSQCREKGVKDMVMTILGLSRD